MIVTCHCFFHPAKKLRSGAIVRFSDNSSFNYTDTSINSLEVDSLSDTRYWVNPILYLYYTLHKNWSPG